MKSLQGLLRLILIAGVLFSVNGCKPKAKAHATPTHAQAPGAKKFRLTDSNLADVIDEIRDNYLTYKEAAEIAIRWENANVSIEKMAGEFLIYKGTNRAGRYFRVALLRDKKREAENAGDFRTLEQYYDDVAMSKGMDWRDPISDTGFLRIAGTAHFTTRNGVIIELPRIESVPKESVESLPR